MSTTIAAEKPPQSILDFTAKDIDGNEVSLRKHSGKVLLVVNVASQCGYTPQYKGLGALFKKYKERSSMILGFPSDNFGGQEPGSDSEIKSFCQTNFGVTFDMFSKISVKGRDQHPL
ncbi:MAG TPA: glutathione peroxidase, partial [Bacteroidota bacterium]|nr:glutathione peroxidase [Bacteroidota bacterium]